MCSRHAEPGAGAPIEQSFPNGVAGEPQTACREAHETKGTTDSETPHWQDSTCDYCAKTVYRGRLHAQTLGGSTAMVCEECFTRDQRAYEESAA